MENLLGFFDDEPLVSKDYSPAGEYFHAFNPPLHGFLDTGKNQATGDTLNGKFKILNIYDETPDVKTFRLGYWPDQVFEYLPGQYITISIVIDGRKYKRSFSLASSPSWPFTVGITVKRMPNGVVSNWLNLNKLAHLIADHLETHSVEINHLVPPPITPSTSAKPIIWIAEPTDDLIDQWEALAEAIRQAGADLRPLGLDTYPRSTEAEFLASLHADLKSAHLFVQLLSQVPGRHPRDGTISFTSLQSANAGDLSKQQQLTFLQWRNRDLNLDQVTDENHRQLLTGAIACGFEEFRQRVLAALQILNQPSPLLKPPPNNDDESLAICISAHKADYNLGLQVRDIIVELGADAFTTQTKPAPDQTPPDFNIQLDKVIANSEGMIIVYGQTPPVWVQAQYMLARKALAQKHKGLWSALLDGPPLDKPGAGLAGRNLMTLECRDGLLHYEIERFVNTLRGASHA